jgi:chaperonin GroEL
MSSDKKQVFFGDESRNKLIAGINVLANAVKVTLGPKGKNVVIQREWSAPTVTKDGVSVAREIELEDNLMNTGVRMIKQVATQTMDDAGDGTTTATVLAQSMIREGVRAVTAGATPINIKRGIDLAVDTLIDELNKLKKSCDTPEEIKQVATVSANGDEEIGSLIAEAVSKVGKKGVITVEDGSSLKNELSVVKGLQYEHGYLSPYFVNSEKQKCILENPYILISDRPILNINDLVPILEQVAPTRRSFLIMAESVENEALATVVVNTVQGNIKACAVRGPDWKGEKRKHLLEDIAILTGGTVISEDLGKTLAKATLEDLGQCAKVEVTQNTTTIISGHGNSEDIENRISEIQFIVDDPNQPYGKDFHRERIAKLTGGVAVIRAGSATQIAMKEKRDRIDDALHATRAALEDGIVPGGGVAFLRLKESLKNLKGKNDDQNSGIKIVDLSLEEPLKQIVINAGEKPDVVINRVLENSGNYGYDASENKFGDMLAMGIVDPAKVTKSTLINAASIAGMVLTTDCAICMVPETKTGDYDLAAKAANKSMLDSGK